MSSYINVGIVQMMDSLPLLMYIFIYIMRISNEIFDSCHGRVSGINKICIRSSSYCRSQATAT